VYDEEYKPLDVQDEEDEAYVLTPWGCLYAVLHDYGIDAEHISGKVGKHIVEDFMELMVRAGYVLTNGSKEDGE